jgi:hypothetical protein
MRPCARMVAEHAQHTHSHGHSLCGGRLICSRAVPSNARNRHLLTKPRLWHSSCNHGRYHRRWACLVNWSLACLRYAILQQHPAARMHPACLAYPIIVTQHTVRCHLASGRTDYGGYENVIDEDGNVRHWHAHTEHKPAGADQTRGAQMGCCQQITLPKRPQLMPGFNQSHAADRSETLVSNLSYPLVTVACRPTLMVLTKALSRMRWRTPSKRTNSHPGSIACTAWLRVGRMAAG